MSNADLGRDGARRAGSCLPELLEILSVVKVDLETPVAIDVPLVDGLGLDSLDVLEFVALIEQRYRIPVADEEIEQLPDLASIAAHLDERLAA